MAKNNKKTKVAIIIFLITAIIATALTAVLAFGDSNEGYRTITVIEIQGTVGVVHDNIEYSAYTGMHLEEGYTVVTGGNSYIRLLLDDDKYVKLESGTKAIFSEVSGGKTSINIERGALVAEVTKPLQVDEDFIVNTPNAILAVRGTLFRVDLSRNDKGELNTDVMTYGGAVSSKRIQPSGEVEDIEVTIKEGFKATVNMDDKETVYLVDDVKVDLSDLVGKPSNENKPNDTTTETNLNGEIIESAPITLESVLMPIVVEDIPDDDLVDIYFASENGHSMFIETKEIEEKIVERNIDVTEKTSVYEVAQKVKEPVEIVIPDDNKSLVTTTEPVTKVVAVQGPPNDGVGDETTTEITTVPSTTAPTTTVPSTTAPTTTVSSTTAPTTTVPSTTAPTTIVPSTTAPTTTVPSTTVSTTTVPTTESTTVTTTEQTTEETTVHIHTETIEETKATCTENGLKTVKCSTCGEIISETVLAATGHSETTNTVNATCTTDGKKTVSCSVCSETLSETVLTATGHSEIFSGAKDAHTECSVCYEVLSTNHSYTTSTTNPSCTLDGGTTYVCECGYNYTETIPATGHTEKTATVDATCIEDGKTTVSCSVCTETLSETVIPATGHTEENGSGADIHTKCSVCGSTVKDGSYHDYTDEVTTPNSCTTAGVLTRTCTCGWSYTEAIPASHKKSDDGLTCVNGCGGVWVDLNITNFPDSMFLSYISTTYDADGNSALIGDEVTGVVTINVSGNSTTDGGYTDLTGIKNFTNLVNVNCAYNSGITSLDLSGLTLLTELDVTGLTGLETLNISGCTNLTDEKITGLDTCTALIELNVSGCTNIAELNLNSNIKVETVNLSNCSALTSFVINDNTIADYALNSINLSGCTSLETLTINNCLSLTTIDFTDLNALKTIDLGGCQYFAGEVDLSGKTALTTITMGGNKVESLNVTGCTALTDVNMTATTTLSTIQGINTCTELATLNLVNTGIGALDLSSNQKLTKVWVTNCASLKNLDLTRSSESTTLSSLNINNCTALTNLNLYNCKGIATLAVSSLTALETLNLSYSGVTTFNGATDTMNFSSNTALKNIYLNGISTFTGVNVSTNTSLEEFALVDNSNVTTLEFTGITTLKTLVLSDVSSLTSLNIGDCTALESVTLLNTGLTSLSLDGYGKLSKLWVYNNSALATISVNNAPLLTDVKLAAVTTNTALTSLAITNCTTLTSLDVTYLTALTTLNVSGCTTLTSLGTIPSTVTDLNVYNSGIETLDVTNCSALSSLLVEDCASLTSIDASGTDISEIIVSGCTSLVNLNLSDTAIVGLDASYSLCIETINVRNCKSLESLDINTETNNNLINLNVTDCTSMMYMQISNSNLLQELDLSGLETLSVAYINDCIAITSIDISDTRMTNVSNLNIDSLTNLKTLKASNADLSDSELASMLKDTLESIDVSNNSAVTTIDVSNYTMLKDLTVTGCIGLTSLNASNAAITSLDVSTCTVLTSLNASGCSVLTSLGTIPSTVTELNLSGTGITNLDVSVCTNLTELSISGCSLITELNVSNTQISDWGSVGLGDITNLMILNATNANLNVLSVDSMLSNLTEKSRLTTLVLDGNTFATVDLQAFSGLTSLSIQNNTELASLDLTNCSNISSVNITGCSSLTTTDITLPAGKDESIITGP